MPWNYEEAAVIEWQSFTHSLIIAVPIQFALSVALLCCRCCRLLVSFIDDTGGCSMSTYKQRRTEMPQNFTEAVVNEWQSFTHSFIIVLPIGYALSAVLLCCKCCRLLVVLRVDVQAAPHSVLSLPEINKTRNVTSTLCILFTSITDNDHHVLCRKLIFSTFVHQALLGDRSIYGEHRASSATAISTCQTYPFESHL